MPVLALGLATTALRRHRSRLDLRVLNNLPAAVLFSAQPPPHPRALLIGLDLGPNLAVTGSLSAVLWLQAAHSVGARPSITTYSRFGLLLVPLTLVAALLAMLAANW